MKKSKFVKLVLLTGLITACEGPQIKKKFFIRSNEMSPYTMVYASPNRQYVDLYPIVEQDASGYYYGGYHSYYIRDYRYTQTRSLSRRSSRASSSSYRSGSSGSSYRSSSTSSRMSSRGGFGSSSRSSSS